MNDMITASIFLVFFMPLSGLVSAKPQYDRVIHGQPFTTLFNLGRALKSSATLTEVRCCDGKIIQPFET